MQYHTHAIESLPRPEPPGAFLNIAENLRACPEAVSTDDKEAYKDFVLSLSPPELTTAQIDILEKVFPADWKAYSEFHFGESA
jgi:hypothetical protein